MHGRCVARALAAAGAVVVMTGCGGGGGESKATVLAASSLAEVLPEIAPEARYSFGGSNQLAEQVRQGAPFDVYVSASPRYTQELLREGLVREPILFARNMLVLIVPEANPANLHDVHELARGSGTRLVAAGPEVPVGAYTRQVLERLGLAAVLDRAVSLEPDVKGVVGKVALGEADAGFVYTTDVAAVVDEVSAIPLPASAQPAVGYEVAIAAEPDNPSAAAAFVDGLLGPVGREQLRLRGFGLP